MIALLGLDSVAAVLIVLAAGCALAQLLRLVRELGGPDEPESGSGDDGGLKRPDPPSPPDRGDGEPPWWPDFERDFADYLERVSAVARS